ncbi:TPA: protein TolA [Enterobacter cloacae]|uniref:cell envelope integrity TolA C-terminal domain-containing protein n=1 Tax=Enterobacter cloacae TaxID=550 RepID=UPI000667A632|nr:cell envelope integrity TolA C-terminal domain-containing protein [Enterobacter cloacae]SSG92961.1 TolA protein [Klebsiella pneumoniae]HAS1007015.1 protein TolA [Enterobacter cloacae]HAS1145004.1 protein TolA [Enterobacter cloacae]HAS1180695.1 protein TolA [Enterobacter cloacae]HAS1195987.1 protein TolA [Enterobacter cloacae]
MASGYIRRIVLLLSFLLVACTSDRGQLNPAQTPFVTSQAQLNKNQIYAAQISHAVSEHFSDIQSYRGKKCTVRISIQPDGMLLSAATEKGDSKFCLAFLSALSRANIPPARDKKTWQKFRNTSLALLSEEGSSSLLAAKTLE